MDEFGAALQFFEGFGENWHALKECLSYLDEWMPARAYVLVLTSCQEVLSQSEEQDLKWLIVTLQEVGEWWSRPITDNQRFNRPAIPFHAILTCPPESIRSVSQRIASVGAEVVVLDRPLHSGRFTL